MTDDDEARAARARARANWPIVRKRLDELPEVELIDGSPEELLTILHELTLIGWALARRPIPQYTRQEMPGRLLRGREPTAA